MNILMTADSVGGIWNHVLELARGLQRYGCTIHLVVFGGSLSAAQRSEVLRLANVRCTESDLRLEWMDEPWKDLRVAGELLHKLAGEVQPSVVHLNSYSLAARVNCHAPIVVGAHSCVLSWWDAVKREPAPPWLQRYGHEVSRGLRAADLVIAPTHKMLYDVRRIYQVDFPGAVIANGIDRAAFSSRAKVPQILSVGRLWDEAKNIQLLDAIAKEVKWPILVAGDAVQPGSRNQSCFAHVRALGKLSSSGMHDQLSRTPIYAAPALYEPFGLAVLEAALSGCALVLADIASFRELWEGAAMLLDPSDTQAWAAELNRLISDKKSQVELAERSRERATRYTRTAMCGRYHNLYRNLHAPTRGASLEQAA
jgi:glycosyltransferase involved in cell wall biosynthesis